MDQYEIAGWFVEQVGEEILKYCLGEEWESMDIIKSLPLINEKLNINLEPSDPIEGSVKMIKEAYDKIKNAN